MEHLRIRSDFLRAARGIRRVAPGLTLEICANPESEAVRVGFTATRKIGNAVVRNRMKRRLRALARTALPSQGVAGSDHVLIGRTGGVERDYAALGTELAAALAKARR